MAKVQFRAKPTSKSKRHVTLEDYYASCDWYVDEVSAEEYFENIS